MTIAQQCELLGLVRSSYYYQPRPETEETLRLLRRLHELYLEFPYYGSPRLAVVLAQELGQTTNPDGVPPAPGWLTGVWIARMCWGTGRPDVYGSFPGCQDGNPG